MELPPGQRAFVESHRPYGSHLLDQARAGYLEAIYRLAVLLATDPAHQEDALALLIHTAAAGHAPSIDLLDSEHGQVPSAAARHAHRLAKTAKDNGSKDEALAFAQAAARGVLHTTLGFPISIYLGEESGHEQVEASVERLARSAGLTITERDDPVLGSWYRAMRARLTAVAQSPAGQDVRADLAHRAEIELARRPEAEVAAILMANVAQVIPTLHYYKDAVIRLGPVLIVKNDWALSVQQLTTRQQRILDRAPHLAAAPAEILTSLGLPEGADLP